MARNTQTLGKKMKCIQQDLEYSDKTEKRGKCDTNCVGPGIWRETLKKLENEKCTLQGMECGEKTKKGGKGNTKTV